MGTLKKGLHVPAGDSLEVLTYERLLPLKAERTALGTLQAVRKGDCLVAFSRREVHAIKRALDAWGALKCCVVYGALPAEARTQQVQLRHGGAMPMCTLMPCDRTLDDFIECPREALLEVLKKRALSSVTGKVTWYATVHLL